MSANPVRDDTRYDSQPLATCPVDGTKFQPVARRLFCTPRCRQQAFRLRSRHVDTVTLVDITKRLRHQHRLVDQNRL